MRQIDDFEYIKVIEDIKPIGILKIVMLKFAVQLSIDIARCEDVPNIWEEINLPLYIANGKLKYCQEVLGKIVFLGGEGDGGLQNLSFCNNRPKRLRNFLELNGDSTNTFDKAERQNYQGAKRVKCTRQGQTCAFFPTNLSHFLFILFFFYFHFSQSGQLGFFFPESL